MNDINDAIDEVIPPGPPETPRQRKWRKSVAKWMLFFGLLPLVLIAGLAFLLDTQAGHRFIIDRIEGQNPKSGLKIKIGRIDGSIYGRATIRDLQLGDPKGTFFTADQAKLDWQPVKFALQNTLDIDDLWIAKADLLRMPELIPDKEKQQILPDFNIRLGHFKVDRLILNESVAGRYYTVGLEGKADVRGGRADVKLAANSLDTKDKLDLALIAVPDQNIFDVDASVIAPADGVVAGMTGIKKPLGLAVKGNGSWEKWTGALVAKSGETELANVFLGAEDGQYSVKGDVRPETIVAPGILQRISRGGIKVDATSTFENNRLDGRVDLASAALNVTASGMVDLGDRMLNDVTIDSRILQPQQIMNSMQARDLRFNAKLNGPMLAPNYNYRLTSPRMQFGRNVLNTVNVQGIGSWAAGAVKTIPVRAKVASITGNGEMADELTRNVEVAGALQLRGTNLTSNLMQVSTSRINGKMVVAANLGNGTYNVGFDGRLPNYEIPGMGRVDIVTNLNVKPQGRGVNVVGKAAALVTRLDNSFFQTLAGGNPRILTDFNLTPDGRTTFSNLKISAPLIEATANGYRRPDGTFYFTGQGRHDTYGPVKLALDGEISRPQVRMVLASPNEAAGLANVEVNLDPSAAGYRFTTKGDSILGPFTGNGAILLPRSGSTVIEIAQLEVSGTTATGELRPVTGGLDGRIALAGGGLDGALDLGVAAGVQEVRVDLVADNASFPGPPPLRIGKGTIKAVVRMLDGGPVVVGQVDVADVEGFGFKARTLNADIRDLRNLGDMSRITLDATIKAERVEGSGFQLSTVDSDIRIINGVGGASGKFVGSGPGGFSFGGNAQFSQNSIRFIGDGSLAGRPINFRYPLVMERVEDGWRLNPNEIRYAGGTIRLAGLYSSKSVEVDAAIKDMPLALLDAINPKLQLGGVANGVIQYRSANRSAPEGKVELRIAGLTRSGLALASKPVDAAINAVLDARNASMRGVIVDNGETIGRVQAHITPLGTEGGLMDRLRDAPMLAQARYNGAIDTLWRLTGLEAVDLSGPVAIAADITGTLGDPQIDGAVKADSARLENAVTGTVVTDIQAVGRFDGSRFDLRQFSGKTTDNGTVKGSGVFELSADRGFSMDVNIDAQHALLIDRDDLVATITGPIRMRSDADGGLISGDVVLDKGEFVLGQATAAEALPVINVREINNPDGDDADIVATSAAMAWGFDITARGSNDLKVTGMGLDSVWRTDLLISGSTAEPRILGSAELVRGAFQFAGRLFTLDEGNITFTGSVPADPTLDIVAVADVNGLDATVNIGGSGLKPEITFSSVPALPEDELLSRILFGESITNISVTEAAQLGVAVASLRGGGGLDPINALRDAVGLDRLRILSPDELTGRKTAIAAGKYITRRVYVEVITDGQGYSATQLEFSITRWLSLLGSISTIGRHSINAKVEKDY